MNCRHFGAKTLLFVYVAQAACSACCKAWFVTENLSGRVGLRGCDQASASSSRSFFFVSFFVFANIGRGLGIRDKG